MPDVSALALMAGAAIVGQEAVSQAVKDSYDALKKRIVNRLGPKSDIKNAVRQIEKKPDSKARQDVLKEELEAAGTDDLLEFMGQAQRLLALQGTGAMGKI